MASFRESTSGSASNSIHNLTASTAPFVQARPLKGSNRQGIALISVQADPAADHVPDAVMGQGVYARELGKALARLGWQVDIFTRKQRETDAKIVEHSPYCRTIRLSAGDPNLEDEAEILACLPQFVSAFQTFQTKQGTHYPLVHTNGWLSAWVGLQLQAASNVQLIHTYHALSAIDYGAVDPLPPIAQVRQQVEQQIMAQAQRIVATSPQENEFLQDLMPTQGTIDVIPCGTDLESLNTVPKAEARTALGLNPDAKIVLYVGRFAPHKGIDTLVRAVAKLVHAPAHPNLPGPETLELLLVGGNDADHLEDPECKRIQAIVQECELSRQTQFTGQVAHDRISLYYTAADICVIPSRYEPFGLVAIEAMACGTPVVASDVGGLRFTVMPEETGLLVPPEDVDGFAAAIQRVLADELWAQRLKRNASARVHEDFSWAGVAAKLSDLYRRLLAQTIMDQQFWTPNLVEERSVPSSASRLTKVS